MILTFDMETNVGNTKSFRVKQQYGYRSQRNVPTQLPRMGGQMRLHRAKLGLAPGLPSMALNTTTQHSLAQLLSGK